MASTLKINTLTGVTTAGSIAVTGEGNSTTTNLQQGLAKCWADFNGSGTAALTDSFNSGSFTDNGTGDYTITITNDMASVNYATMTSKDDGTTNNWSMPNENNARTKATGSYHVMSTYGGTSTNNTKYDAVRFYSALMGDLA